MLHSVVLPLLRSKYTNRMVHLFLCNPRERDEPSDVSAADVREALEAMQDCAKESGGAVVFVAVSHPQSIFFLLGYYSLQIEMLLKLFGLICIVVVVVDVLCVCVCVCVPCLRGASIVLTSFCQVRGDHYGWVPSGQDVPDDLSSEWPGGCSIQHAELQAALALGAGESRGLVMYRQRGNNDEEHQHVGQPSPSEDVRGWRKRLEEEQRDMRKEEGIRVATYMANREDTDAGISAMTIDDVGDFETLLRGELDKVSAENVGGQGKPCLAHALSLRGSHTVCICFVQRKPSFLLSLRSIMVLFGFPPEC